MSSRAMHLAAATAFAVTAIARGLRAEGPPAPTADTSSEGAARERAAMQRRLDALAARGPYFDLFATAMLGDGLRFNNPYRLSHELGRSGESLSTTSPYFELALSAATGQPGRIEHGGRLGFSWATGGVPQQVITPAYQAVLRPRSTWILDAWAGVPIILSPDPNVGAELAIGGAWLARAGLGVSFALVGDLFYGAGTRETSAALYPVLSAQFGILVGHEVLP